MRHTHEAQEVDEETFFYSRETGGTVVSSALREMLRVQKERYLDGEWNIYTAQASDGDNFSGDAERCIEIAAAGRDHAGQPVLRLRRDPRRAGDGAVPRSGQRHGPLAGLSQRRPGLGQLSP